MKKRTRIRLYGPHGAPASDFNSLVRRWLTEELAVAEHTKPAAFAGLRIAYDAIIKDLVARGQSARDAHRATLSSLTQLMFSHDLTEELKGRLASSLINDTGFRTTLSQGVAKNVGENFVNLLVFAIATLLEHQDEILVDKGLPPALKTALTLHREVNLQSGTKQIQIPLEGDFAVFSRSDPLSAVVVSAKTRLKEAFHIGTMWALFFDMIDDPSCLTRWQLTADANVTRSKLCYAFATADMVNAGGKKSQGPDVERPEPRNLIAMDASFFDYVFVSKTGIPHVATTLNYGTQREALFHELGCILDLVEQKFGVNLRL